MSNVDFSRGHLREVNSPSKNLVFLVLLVSASSDMKRRCTCVFLRVVYVKVHSPRKAACALSCLLSTPRRTYKLRITVSNVDFSRGHLREVNSPSLVLLVSASSDMTYKLRITVSNVDFSRGHLREVNSPSKNLVFLVLLVSASSDMKRSCTCVFLRVVYVKAHPPLEKPRAPCLSCFRRIAERINFAFMGSV